MKIDEKKIDEKNYDQHLGGTPSRGLHIWLDAVDRDIAELNRTVKSLKSRAIQVMIENIELREMLKSSVIEKGESLMNEREKALADNPF